MQQRRLSLGLKASYFTDAGDAADTEDAQVSLQQHSTACLHQFSFGLTGLPRVTASNTSEGVAQG